MVIRVDTLERVILWIFAFFVLLDLNSVYTRMTYNPIPTVAVISTLSLFMCFFSFFNENIIKKKNIIIVFSYFCYILFFALFIPKTNIVSFLIKFALVIPILIIYFAKNNQASYLFFKYYSNIIFFLAIISLIFFPFTNVLHIIPSMGDILVSWRGVSPFHNYLYLFFNNEYSNYTANIIRNTGIFAEAPQYGLNLIIALMYELCICTKTRILNIVILCIAIITTVSSGSIIVMLIMLYTKLLATDSDNKYTGFFKLFFSIILLIAFLYIILKLFGEKVSTGNSFNIRVDDFRSGFSSWKLHPLFGNGYGNDDAIQQFVGNFRSWNKSNGIIGFSNSLAMILSNGGIALLLIYVWSASIFLKNSSIKLRNKLQIVGVIFFMLLLNSFAFSMMMIVLLSVGFSKSKNKEIKRNL